MDFELFQTLAGTMLYSGLPETRRPRRIDYFDLAVDKRSHPHRSDEYFDFGCSATQ